MFRVHSPISRTEKKPTAHHEDITGYTFIWVGDITIFGDTEQDFLDLADACAEAIKLMRAARKEKEPCSEPIS